MGRKRVDALHGFTLIEALAMLAIGSVLILATTSLVHDVARNFDRGTRGASDGERVMLVVERLAQDFGSARYVLWDTANGPSVAFTADAASDDAPAKVVFVGSAGVMSGPQGDEVVTLTIEPDEDVTRLIRRRAAWTGSHMRFEEVTPGDPVVLLEGKVDIAFVFGRVAPNGALQWSENWADHGAMPRFVRLILRDRDTGRDLLREADFLVRADAPAACGRPDANSGCLSMALSDIAHAPIAAGGSQ
jgi:hypothetical protein